MTMPVLSVCRVIAVDSQSGGIYVQLDSGQVPAAGIVRMLRHGQSDGARIQQEPLPVAGTDGLCCFLYGSSLAGIWMGAVETSFQTARTLPNDPHAKYFAHGSGHWTLLDQYGNYTNSFPDGTWIGIASSAIKPVPTRRIVNSGQTFEDVAYPDSVRVVNVPSPYYVMLNHGSGASIAISPSGAISVSAASGQNISFNGQNINLTAMSTVTMTTPNVNCSQQLSWNTASASTQASTHTHGSVQSGSSHTAQPDPGS